MENFLLYLLKVSAGTIVLYLFFLLFFSRDTFYLRNRIFLIMILILPVIIPLIKTLSLTGRNAASEPVTAIDGIITSGVLLETSVSEKIISFDFINLLIFVYFIAACICLLRVLLSVARTLIIIKEGTTQNTGFPKVVISNTDYPSFSFFPYVVMSRRTFESSDFQEILWHENTHVRQGHTFDLILCELFIAFQWFNPFVWLIKRSVVLNHEYMADNYSIKRTNDTKEYQYLLLNIPAHHGMFPATHNFSSSIKNRLVMINKKPTRNLAALKNILILPLAALLFILFSFKSGPNSPESVYQGSPFSKSSEETILKFIAQNTMYPSESKNTCDTGRVFVSVKIDKGGVIKECKAFSGKMRQTFHC